MKIKLLIFGFLLATFFGINPISTNAQIATLNFEEFQPWLEKENDTVYVINFWATWCAPCVKELPEFESINKNYKDKKFKMLLVSLDFLKNKESRLIPFVTDKNLQAQVVLLYAPNANAWIDKVDSDWSGAIPATLIYKGKKRIFNEGSYTYNELDQIISQLIKN
ncbi:MAG: TlpA disulfide reductase family protein [Ignavibacteria bacterium]|nr:TlpA disulfide reductase family protein [Ignavibacteria bacterium]